VHVGLIKLLVNVHIYEENTHKFDKTILNF